MKTLLIILLTVLSLNAADVNWIESYEKAAVIAKAENRPMLLFMNRPECGACQFMKENVFIDESLYSYINENFVPVSLNIYKNDAPEALQVEVTPVFHFIKKDGSKIQESLVGGKTGLFFLKILKKAAAGY